MNGKKWMVVIMALLVLATGKECVAQVVEMADSVIGAAEVPDMDYEVLEAENAELRWKLKKMWVIFAAILLWMLYFVYGFLRGEFRRYMDKYLAVAAGLKKSMDEGRKEGDPMRKAVDDLFRAQFDTIDELCRTYYEFEGSGRDAERIYREVMAQIRKLTEDRKTMNALVADINRYHDNLMERFAADYPKASEADRNLFVYIVAGFSSQAISLFIKKDVTAAYRQKHRLKEKIMKRETVNKEEYLKFF